MSRTLGFFLALFLICPPLWAEDDSSTNDSGRVSLTVLEQQWLAAHEPLRVGIDPQWPPFSFVDTNGVPHGIDIDLLNYLTNRLGVKMVIVPATSWVDTMNKVKRGEVDFTLGTVQIPERDRLFTFTDAYLSFPVGLITRKDSPFLALQSALAYERIASPEEHYITTELQRKYPHAHFVSVMTVEQSLLAVSTGDADVTVVNLASASHVILKDGLNNLKIAGLYGDPFEARLAVRRELMPLRGILNKGLQAIDPVKKEQIYASWLMPEVGETAKYGPWKRTAAVTGVVAGIIVLLVLLWGWIQVREIRRRQLAEARLRDANKRLANLNAEKSRWLRVAAHDLRNPLSSVILSADLIKSFSKEHLSTIQKPLQVINSAATHMQRLVNNLLNNEAIENGRSLIIPQPMDMTAIVQTTVERLRPTVEHKGIKLSCELPGKSLVIFGDPNAVSQIVDNLISNAMKFSEPGKEIRVQVASTIGCRLSVSDQGPGIAKEELPQLFKKFVKLKNEPTRNESSTGLGLSIVKHLVEAMSGRVWCESEVGKGSIFVVEFPLMSPP